MNICYNMWWSYGICCFCRHACTALESDASSHEYMHACAPHRSGYQTTQLFPSATNLLTSPTTDLRQLEGIAVWCVCSLARSYHTRQHAQQPQPPQHQRKTRMERHSSQWIHSCCRLQVASPLAVSMLCVLRCCPLPACQQSTSAPPLHPSPHALLHKAHWTVLMN